MDMSKYGIAHGTVYTSLDSAKRAAKRLVANRPADISDGYVVIGEMTNGALVAYVVYIAEV